MRNIKLLIEYDGTNYAGWQRQAAGRTIQEEIEKVELILIPVRLKEENKRQFCYWINNELGKKKPPLAVVFHFTDNVI